jgi:hypothetical protein
MSQHHHHHHDHDQKYPVQPHVGPNGTHLTQPKPHTPRTCTDTPTGGRQPHPLLRWETRRRPLCDVGGVCDEAPRSGLVAASAADGSEEPTRYVLTFIHVILTVHTPHPTTTDAPPSTRNQIDRVPIPFPFQAPDAPRGRVPAQAVAGAKLPLGPELRPQDLQRPRRHEPQRAAGGGAGARPRGADSHPVPALPRDALRGDRPPRGGPPERGHAGADGGALGRAAGGLGGARGAQGRALVGDWEPALPHHEPDSVWAAGQPPGGAAGSGDHAARGGPADHRAATVRARRT